MRSIKLTLAALAIALFSSLAMANTAAAADFSGPYMGLGIDGSSGSSATSDYADPFKVAPKGASLNIVAGDRFTVAGHIVLGVEGGLTLGNRTASGTWRTCDTASCGYDADLTRTADSHWDASLGVSVGDSVGPVLVSLNGGAIVGDVRKRDAYDYHGAYTNDVYQTSGYRAGWYAGASVETKVSSTLSVRANWRYTRQVEQSWQGVGYHSEMAYTGNSVQVALIKQF